MTFDELFLWALDNGIELTVYNKQTSYPHSQFTTYFASFRDFNGIDVIGQEFVAETPDLLLKYCEHALQKLFNEFKMKKPRSKKKKK